MSVGVALMWPLVAVFGFLGLTGVVVALGATATARYEFERNGARELQRRSSSARTSPAHPAGSRLTEAETQPRPQAVGVAVRPVPAAGGAPVTGWWLVAESSPQALAGPFPDRMDADWAALAGEHEATAVYGVRGADGRVVRRPSPDERGWLDELGQQLDRLPEDWDELLSDTDELTTDRNAPPDAILHEVYRRTGDKPFKHIDDVISRDELIALSESYKRVAGYDKERLKAGG